MTQQTDWGDRTLPQDLDTTGAWDWDTLTTTEAGPLIWHQPGKPDPLRSGVPIIPELPRPTFGDGVTRVPDGWALTIVARVPQWLPWDCIDAGRANRAT